MLLMFAKTGLPAIVAILYAFTSMAYFIDGQKGAGVLWVSYAAANLGMLMSLKGI